MKTRTKINIVLDVRVKSIPIVRLQDLYGPNFTQFDLLKAHRALDSAVMELYEFPVKADFTEAYCVSALMEMCQKLTGGIGCE